MEQNYNVKESYVYLPITHTFKIIRCPVVVAMQLLALEQIHIGKVRQSRRVVMPIANKHEIEEERFHFVCREILDLYFPPFGLFNEIHR